MNPQVDSSAASRAALNAQELVYLPNHLRGQRILVTGGGTGLGRVMAEASVFLGAEVYICWRRASVLDQAASQIQHAHRGRVTAIPCDICKQSTVVAMLDRIWSDGGALTGLVNNAAANFITPTEKISPLGFDASSNFVFRGSFMVTQACGQRWLAEDRRASVLSIVTTWVWNGSTFTVPLAMSKAGVQAMPQSLAVEWGPRGIRLNCIAPGLFPTEGMLARLDPDGSNFSDITSRNPMRRAGRMSELANLAVCLMSPGAEYVNGQTIAIDCAEYQATGGNFSGLVFWTTEDWTRAAEVIQRKDAADWQQR